MAAVRPQKDFRSSGVPAEPVRSRIENVGVGAAQREAVARQCNRRRDQRGAWQPAVFATGMVEPHHRARHCGSKVAVTAEIVDLVAFRAEVHRGGRRHGGGLAEIDEGLPAVRKVDRHEPAAADVAAARVDDGERIADRNCGIDRVAARLKHADPHFRGQPMRRNHDPVLGLDRRRECSSRHRQHGN